MSIDTENKNSLPAGTAPRVQRDGVALPASPHLTSTGNNSARLNINKSDLMAMDVTNLTPDQLDQRRREEEVVAARKATQSGSAEDSVDVDDDDKDLLLLGSGSREFDNNADDINPSSAGSRRLQYHGAAAEEEGERKKKEAAANKEGDALHKDGKVGEEVASPKEAATPHEQVPHENLSVDSHLNHVKGAAKFVASVAAVEMGAQFTTTFAVDKASGATTEQAASHAASAVKNNAINIAESVGKSLIPYYTARQEWKAGNYWSAAGWAAVDTGTIIAALVPVGGEIADTAILTMKATRAAKAAKAAIKAAEIAADGSKVVEVAADGAKAVEVVADGAKAVKTTNKIVQVANKINKAGRVYQAADLTHQAGTFAYDAVHDHRNALRAAIPVIAKDAEALGATAINDVTGTHLETTGASAADYSHVLQVGMQESLGVMLPTGAPGGASLLTRAMHSDIVIPPKTAKAIGLRGNHRGVSGMVPRVRSDEETMPKVNPVIAAKQMQKINHQNLPGMGMIPTAPNPFQM